MFKQGYFGRPSRRNDIISNFPWDETAVILSHSQSEAIPFVVDILIDSPFATRDFNGRGCVVKAERNEVGGSFSEGKSLTLELSVLVQDDIRLSVGEGAESQWCFENA